MIMLDGPCKMTWKQIGIYTSEVYPTMEMVDTYTLGLVQAKVTVLNRLLQAIEDDEPYTIAELTDMVQQLTALLEE